MLEYTRMGQGCSSVRHVIRYLRMHGIIRALKWINGLPVRATFKHFQTFGTAAIDSPESWDALRRAHPHFSIPEERAAWVATCSGEIKKDGQDGGLMQRARDVYEVLHAHGIHKIFSVGVGGAGLEFQLKHIDPTLYIHATEYAPENVMMLQRVFTECEKISQFDFMKDDWRTTDTQTADAAVLMYRVDPHATDEEWRDVFEKMYAAGVQHIIFIPCRFVTILSLVNRFLRHWRWRARGQRLVSAGYVRTQKVFEDYWNGLYTQELHTFGGLKGYWLMRK